MRKLFALVCLLIAALFVFEGCKKGPEDPFLSFKSRKKRVEGYWRVTQLLYNNVDSTTLTRTNSFSPITGNAYFTCGDFTKDTTWVYKIKFRFDSDGRYEKDSTHQRSLVWKFTNLPPTNPLCRDRDTMYLDNKLITKGFWMFAGATGDIKNKERMFLTDGEDQYDGRSYEILKCSDKEMKLVYASSFTDSLGTRIVSKIQYNMEAISADEYQNDREMTE